MRISWQTLKIAGGVIAGVLFAGALLDALSIARSMIALKEAIALTVLLAILLAALDILVRWKGIPTDKDGKARVTKLNWKVWSFAVGIVVLLWIPAIMQLAGIGLTHDAIPRIASVKVISIDGQRALDVRTTNGSSQPAIVDAIRLKVEKYTIDVEELGTSPPLTFGASYELLVDLSSPTMTERPAVYALNAGSADRFLVTIGATNVKSINISRIPQEHLSRQARDALGATEMAAALVPSCIHIQSSVLQLLLSDGSVLQQALMPLDVQLDRHGPTLSAEPVWTFVTRPTIATSSEKGNVLADRLRFLGMVNDWSQSMSDELNRAFRHPLAGVRIAAAEALAAHGDRLAVDYLNRLVFSDDENIWYRIEAVRSLIRARAARPQDFARILSSKSRAIGGEAIRAVAYYRVHEAEQALVSRLAERNEVGRHSNMVYGGGGYGGNELEEVVAVVTAHEIEETAIALGCVGGPQAIKEIENALSDRLVEREASGELAAALEDALAAIREANSSRVDMQNRRVRHSTRLPRNREQLCTTWKESELIRIREREDEAVIFASSKGVTRNMPWVRDTTENWSNGMIARWIKSHGELVHLHQHKSGLEERQAALFAPQGQGDDVFLASGDSSEEVERAKAQARATLPSAIERFKRGLPFGDRFIVSFTLGKRIHEGVFISVESIEGEIVTGALVSKPVANPDYVFGQRLNVTLGEIYDWTIIDPAGVEEGNYVGTAIEASHGR